MVNAKLQKCACAGVSTVKSSYATEGCPIETGYMLFYAILVIIYWDSRKGGHANLLKGVRSDRPWV